MQLITTLKFFRNYTNFILTIMILDNNNLKVSAFTHFNNDYCLGTDFSILIYLSVIMSNRG